MTLDLVLTSAMLPLNLGCGSSTFRRVVEKFIVDVTHDQLFMETSIYMILSQEIANFLSTPSGFSRFSEFASLMPDVADALLPCGSKRVTKECHMYQQCVASVSRVFSPHTHTNNPAQ